MPFRLCNSRITSQKESCGVFCLTICLIPFLFQQVSNNSQISTDIVDSHRANIPGGISPLTSAKLRQFTIWQFGIWFALFCLIEAFRIMGKDCLGCSLTMVAVLYSSIHVMVWRTLTLFHRSINMCFPATSRLGINLLTASWTKTTTCYIVTLLKKFKLNIQVENSYSIKAFNFNIQVVKSCLRQLRSNIRTAPREKKELRTLQPIL